MKKKPAAPSLFNRTTPASVSGWRENAWSAFLEHIESTCKAAEADPSVPDGQGHAKRIRAGVKLVRAMIQTGQSKESLALQAIDLGSDWMALRVDANMAAAVNAHERRAPKQVVTDEQIEEALKAEGTQAKAAERLGIHPRTIRLRKQKRK